MRTWRCARRLTWSSWVMTASVIPSCVQLVEHFEDRLRVGAVQVAGRFVGEQQARLGDQRPRDRDPLPLTTGQRGRREVHPVRQPDPLQGHPGPGHPLAPRHPDVHHRQRDVLQHGPVVEQVERLEHEPDPLTPQYGATPFAQAHRVDAVEPVDTAGRVVEQPEQMQQRRLPRPGRPDDRQVLPLPDGQVDLPDRLDLGRSGEEPSYADHLHHRRRQGYRCRAHRPTTT